MPILCKFFNSPEGCRFAAKCGHRHLLYCTNPLCAGTAAAKTHPLETCGRMGGPGHTVWIKLKREQAIAAKAAAKAEKASAEKAAEEAGPEEAWEAEQQAAMMRDLYEALKLIAEGLDLGALQDADDEEEVEDAILTDPHFVPTGWVPEEYQPNNQAAE